MRSYRFFVCDTGNLQFKTQTIFIFLQLVCDNILKRNILMISQNMKLKKKNFSYFKQQSWGDIKIQSTQEMTM